MLLQLLQKLYEIINLLCERSKIVHISTHFIIIDKGYDVKINSNNPNEQTVQTFIKKRLPYLASKHLHHEYYFVHRLDYSTSGLMCVPVHKKACQVVSKLIQERQCKKYYIAFVRGFLSKRCLELDFPIGRDGRNNEIEKMCVTKDASREAKTLIIALEYGLFDNYPSTKILVKPITGRRHQIRVHCSHIGHTIVGDYTYSNKKDVKPKRMYLHAIKLVIPNKIEDIDIQTNDLFTEEKCCDWKTFCVYNTLEEALIKIDLL